MFITKPDETLTQSQRLWHMEFNRLLRTVVTIATSAEYHTSKQQAIPSNTQSERKRNERVTAGNKALELHKQLNQSEYDLQEWVKYHHYPEG